jgi:hypothetical protein
VVYICRNSAGLTLPSYFSGKWGWNLRGQTTMRRCEASIMQPPPDPEDVGVRAAYFIGVVFHSIKLTIEVAAPLLVVLNGDAAVHTRVAALEFSPQIHRSETCRWCA